MITALRLCHSNVAVGVGYLATYWRDPTRHPERPDILNASAWVVLAWSTNAAATKGGHCVFARSPYDAGNTVAFKPSELGLYIGIAPDPATLNEQPVKGSKVPQLTADDWLYVHMALRYLRDHGCEGSTKARIVALIAKIGKLPGHV